MSRIYKMTDLALTLNYDWDKAIYLGEIETVKDFETTQEAIDYFENELGSDSERYGIE